MIAFDSSEGQSLRVIKWSDQGLRAMWMAALNDNEMDWAEWARVVLTDSNPTNPHTLALQMIHAACRDQIAAARSIWIVLNSLPAHSRTRPYWDWAAELAVVLSAAPQSGAAMIGLEQSRPDDSPTEVVNTTNDLKKVRTLLVATMKNEGPFLLEWVAWHRLLGFDDIVITQNDSTDMTKEMLICLHAIGAVHFIENSFADDGSIPDGSHQMRAYNRASKLSLYAQADWAISLDGDEFLVVTTGAGKVGDLIEKVGDDADQIHIHWTGIGSCGLSTFQDELVTTRFDETSTENHNAKSRTTFKTLFRTKAFKRFGTHRPGPPNLEPDRAVAASGIRIQRADMGIYSSFDPGGQKYAQVFHYKIRDAESFTLAKTRGRTNPGTPTFESLGYWKIGDAHDRKTDLMSRESGRILAEIERLDAMSNGMLKQLHRASVALSKKRIAEFKTDPDLAKFYEEICRLQARLRGPEERQALIDLYDAGEISWRPK